MQEDYYTNAKMQGFNVASFKVKYSIISITAIDLLIMSSWKDERMKQLVYFACVDNVRVKVSQIEMLRN